MTWRSLALLVCASLGAFARLSPARSLEAKELVVFAAASLREAFEDMATSFEKRHKDVKVRLSFAGSQELRTQIEHGARADVFASADQKPMTILQDAGLVRSPVVFARNQPVLIVPAANPARLRSFADLPKAERILVGAPQAAIGAYTETVLARAAKVLGKSFGEQVAAHIRSRELNVRQVLTKVALGEGDAGIVYRSDALTAKDRVSTIAIPDEINAIADYSIAPLASAHHPELAKAWVEAVRSKAGQDILATAGFLPARPPAKERP